MINNLSLITVNVENKAYHLLCDPSSPISDLKQALFDIGKVVGQVEDQLKQRQEEQQTDEQEAVKAEEKDPSLETDIQSVV